MAKSEIILDRLNKLQEKAWLEEIGAKTAESELRYILATAITRIGVVLLIVFLVQILMGFYRYNTRLMAHYNAKRDFLTLWNGKPSSVKTLSSIFTLPRIEFGRDPKHPLEDIMRAIGGKVEEAVTRMTGKKSSDASSSVET